MGRSAKVDASTMILSAAARHVKEQLQLFGKSTEFLGLVDTFATEEATVKGLVELAASDERHPFPQYASHLLLHIARSYTDKLEVHYESLIDTILSTQNTSVQRNLLGAILCVSLRSYREGELLDWLFAVLNHPDSKPGLLNYSVRKLSQFVEHYPELTQEIMLALELREELSGKAGWVEWGRWALRQSSKKRSKRLV